MRQKRWSYTSERRLEDAPAFIAGYTGKDILRGYRNWFKVNRQTAEAELAASGVALPEPGTTPNPPKEKAVVHIKPAKKKKSGKRRKPTYEHYNSDSDETFAFIAGYTSGGAPYGTTWEELEREGQGLPRINPSMKHWDWLANPMPAIRTETTISQDGRIDFPGVRDGDVVEVIVMFKARPLRFAESSPRYQPGEDEYDPFAGD